MHFTRLVSSLALVVPAMAHIALWDRAMFGFEPENPNSQKQVEPLMHLSFDEWWFHGYIDQPPPPDTFMLLPSGGTYHGQVACNKALTRYGQNAYQQTGIYACDGDGPQGGIGAMHTADAWGSPNPQDVKGCGIAIAYESDEKKVQPEDFTVISANYTCPWFKNVDFQIPADLPPCPPEGCLCSWGWIHSIDAGSQQNYHLVYRCKVEGATGVTPLPKPKTANKCHYPEDTSNCTIGAKQPHYWYQNERNNNPQGQYDPPFYNGDYGFMNGAQTDLFAAVSVATLPPSTAPPASETSPSPITNPASSTSPAVSVVPSRIPSKTCRNHKRAMDRLSASPQLLKRHQQRAAKRATRHVSNFSQAKRAEPRQLSSKTGENRERALDDLSIPQKLLSRHQERAAKRATRHVSRFAQEQREWEQDRARRGLGRESLGRGIY